MGIFLEEKDPRGIRVYLSDKQWEEHIATSTGHPEMVENIAAIRDTIRNPDVIYESHNSTPRDYREVYCKETPLASYYGSKVPYTKVVTSTAGGTAEVITTYSATNVEGGTIGDPVYIRKSTG